MTDQVRDLPLAERLEEDEERAAIMGTSIAELFYRTSLVAAAFHLAGRHPQKRHGHGGWGVDTTWAGEFPGHILPDTGRGRWLDHMDRRYGGGGGLYSGFAEQADGWTVGTRKTRDSINAAMRGEDDRDGKMWLDAFHGTGKTNQPMTRGMWVPPGWTESTMKKGGIIKTPISSFTQGDEVEPAFSWAEAWSDSNPRGGPVVLRAKTGTPVIPVSNWASSYDRYAENELVSSGRFKVDRITDTSDGPILDVSHEGLWVP